MNRFLPRGKDTIKLFLQRLLYTPLFIRTTVLKKSSLPADRRKLQIIVPHRLNWRLTTSTLGAFERLTTGDFSLTLVVNFDSIPADWAGWKTPNLTLIQNQFTPAGTLFSKLFRSENGSMSNAIAIERALQLEPGFEWAFVAHSDSAPLVRAWNEHFHKGLGDGFLCGNMRDAIRVRAAHASGTLFDQQEFRRRGGSTWPRHHFGRMTWDVGDGITMFLHPPGKGAVPVLPNTLDEPELKTRIQPGLLADFAQNGSHISFDLDRREPVFAHMGRGTPRSQSDPRFQHKLPVDSWAEWLDTLR